MRSRASEKPHERLHAIHIMGALRVYTAEKSEFSLDEVNFVQAVAQIAGLAIDLCRANKGLKSSINGFLKEIKSSRKTACGFSACRRAW